MYQSMISVRIPSDPFLYDWEIDFYPDSENYLVNFRDFVIHFSYKLYEREDLSDEELWTAKILKVPSWFSDSIELYSSIKINDNEWVSYTNKLYDFVWEFVIEISYYE